MNLIAREKCSCSAKPDLGMEQSDQKHSSIECLTHLYFFASYFAFFPFFKAVLYATQRLQQKDIPRVIPSTFPFSSKYFHSEKVFNVD
jgi:hypothetical protein